MRIEPRFRYTECKPQINIYWDTDFEQKTVYDILRGNKNQPEHLCVCSVLGNCLIIEPIHNEKIDKKIRKLAQQDADEWEKENGNV